MEEEDNKELKTEEEYTDYWINKGVGQAEHTDLYREISKEKEKKFRLIIDLAIPWQRRAIAELIDEIKSMENARSSIEIDNTLKLLFKQQKNQI